MGEITVEGIEFTGGDRKDDRRNRVYVQEVVAVARIHHVWGGTTGHDFETVVREALIAESCKDGGWGEWTSLRVSSWGAGSRCVDGGYTTPIYITIVAPAEKPSLLLTCDEIWERIGKDSVTSIVETAMRGEIARVVEEKAAEGRRHMAEWFGRHLGETVRERAWEACRFKQRLAALTAELEAEKLVQIEAIGSGDERALHVRQAAQVVDEDSAKDGDPRSLDPRSVQAAFRHLARFAAEPSRGILLNSGKHIVAVEDVT